jgi:hypothetical protein
MMEILRGFIELLVVLGSKEIKNKLILDFNN